MKMKKFLAFLLSAAMVFTLMACGETTSNGGNETSSGNNTQQEQSSGNNNSNSNSGSNKTTAVTNPDAIPDTMTSSDNKYEVAFITDVGQLKDKSFNQGTYDGVKLYAANHNLSYKYYQPANGEQATDDDRFDAMKSACDNGAKVVVCAGFMQGTALEQAARQFKDVNFVFIDGWNMEGLDNVAGITFKEQECGYFAGYAVVQEGYTKLGFCGGGGGTNDACCRYGYGFVQGAQAAAKEKGVQVEMNYTWQYGSSFSPSAELQGLADSWYSQGTEVIFSAGGAIFNSIEAAATKNDGYVVGVDSDQSFSSDTVITSALKEVGTATSWAIGKSYDGTWSELLQGESTSLGAADNATGLPTDTWSLQNYTVAEYEDLFQDVASGKVVVDGTVYTEGKIQTVDFSNVKVNYV